MKWEHFWQVWVIWVFRFAVKVTVRLELWLRSGFSSDGYTWRESSKDRSTKCVFLCRWGIFSLIHLSMARWEKRGRKINQVVKNSLFLQNNHHVAGMKGGKRPARLLMKAPGEKTSRWWHHDGLENMSNSPILPRWTSVACGWSLADTHRPNDYLI